MAVRETYRKSEGFRSAHSSHRARSDRSRSCRWWSMMRSSAPSASRVTKRRSLRPSKASCSQCSRRSRPWRSRTSSSCRMSRKSRIMTRSRGSPTAANSKIDLRHHLLEFSRHRQPVSLILLDIDMFKTVNDIYGHQGGDERTRRSRTRRGENDSRDRPVRALRRRGARDPAAANEPRRSGAHGGAAARCGVALARHAAKWWRTDHGDGVLRRCVVYRKREGRRSPLSRRGHGALSGEERGTKLRSTGNVAQRVRQGSHGSIAEASLAASGVP